MRFDKFAATKRLRKRHNLKSRRQPMPAEFSVLTSIFRRLYRLQEIKEVFVGSLSTLKPNSSNYLNF